MGEEIASLFAKIGADLSGLEAGLQRAYDRINAAASKIGRLGDQLTMGVSLPLAGAGAAAVKFASDLSESMNKSRVVFGQFSAQVEQFTRDAPRSFGMTQQSALEAAGTFGNLFTSMEMGQEQSAKMSMGLVKLAADLGSFNNIDPTIVLEKLRSGLVGEVEPLRTLGINLTVAAAQAKALEMGLAANVKALTPAQLAMARYALIVEQSKNAQGDFERTAGGLANSLRSLKAELIDVATGIGTRLLPFAQQAVKWAKEQLQAFDALNPAMQQNALIMAGIAIAAGPSLKIFAALPAVLTAGVAAVRGFGAALKAVQAGIAAWNAGLSLSSALGAAGISSMTLAMGPLAGLLAGVVATTANYYKQLAAVRKEADKLSGGGWEGFWQRQAEGTKTASSAAAEYVGIVKDLVALGQKPFGAGAQAALAAAEFDKFAGSVASGVESFAIYRMIVEQVANSLGLLIDAEGNLYYEHDIGMGKTKELVASGYALSEAQFKQAKAAESARQKNAALSTSYSNLNAMMMRSATTTTTLGIALTQTGLDAGGILEIIEQRMVAAGTSTTLMDATLAKYAGTLGLATTAEQQLSEQLQLVTDGWLAGIVSAQQYEMYLRAAQAGTLQVGEEMAAQIGNALSYQASMQASATATQQLVLRQLELAQSLKDATQAQLAQTAIQELTRLYQEGKLSFIDYTAAVGSVQEAFGLADEKSRAMTDGLLILTEGLMTGVVPAKQFGDALKLMYTDAQDGKLQIQDVSDIVSGYPAVFTEAQDTVQQLNDKFTSLGEKGPEAANKVKGAFNDASWGAVGTAIDSGIIKGIENGIGGLEEAARAAAKAALDAAMAELGAKSPSKKFMDLGKWSMQGFALGMTNYAYLPEQAGRAAASGALGGATTSYSNVRYGDSPMTIEQNFYDSGAAALGLAYANSARRQRLDRSM